MVYEHGDTIKFRNGDRVLTGRVEGEPVDDGKDILGYVVNAPEFQGVVNINNVIEENN